MNTKWFKMVMVMLTMGLVGSALADTNWTGIAGDGLWKTPGNWSNGVPPAPTGNVNIGYVASSPVILIDETTAAESNSDIHGPNWGATLNIVGGTLNNTGFVMAPVSATEAERSYINVSDGAILNVVNLLLGDNWWFVAPYVTMNVYDEDTMITVSDWLWVGGYLNLYGGTIDVTGNMNLAANTAALGVTRLDIWEGKLIIRGENVSASVPGWIADGFLTAYGQTPGLRGNAVINVDTQTIAGGTILTATPSIAARDPEVLPLNDDGSVGDLIAGQAVMTLYWKTGIDPNTLSGLPFNPDVRKHYIYLSDGGVEEQPVLTHIDTIDQGPDADHASNSVVLAENTTYYWSIELGLDDGQGGAYMPGDPNNILGAIWSFHTVAITPEIRTHPASVIADPDASFSVTASSTAQFFQWFKAADPEPIALEDGGKYAGTKTATLTVTDATLAEEGQYFCVAYYEQTPSEPSDAAWLWTPRLMGHWKFDGNLLDSVADSVAGALPNNGTMAGAEPNFVFGGGLDGGDVIEFFNDGRYVEIENPGFFNFYPQGFSLSYWYKQNEHVGWRLPVSKLDSGSAGWLTGVDSEFRNQAVFIFETADDPAFWADGDLNVNIADGEWVMITVTYDPADATLRMYTNGAVSETLVVEIDDTGALAPLLIGGRQIEGSVAGQIDDVRIYSYPLEPISVADFYLAFETDKYVCGVGFEEPLLFDFNNDCRITIADFAEFAGQWLECQRYPAQACTW